MGSTIKDYWDNAHLTNNISSLSGHTLTGHLASLKVRDLIKSYHNVLCIGVGTGEWVNVISEYVNAVFALDISENARLKLDQKVRFNTNVSQLPSNYFDLAMSLWVTPHISICDLQKQVTEVVRSLKDGGIFALHYNEPTGTLSTAYDINNILQSGGSHRTKEEIDNIVDISGGKVLAHELIIESKDYNINMMVVHVQK